MCGRNKKRGKKQTEFFVSRCFCYHCRPIHQIATVVDLFLSIIQAAIQNSIFDDKCDCIQIGIVSSVVENDVMPPGINKKIKSLGSKTNHAKLIATVFKGTVIFFHPYRIV